MNNAVSVAVGRRSTAIVMGYGRHEKCEREIRIGSGAMLRIVFNYILSSFKYIISDIPTSTSSHDTIKAFSFHDLKHTTLHTHKTFSFTR